MRMAALAQVLSLPHLHPFPPAVCLPSSVLVACLGVKPRWSGPCHVCRAFVCAHCVVCAGQGHANSTGLTSPPLHGNYLPLPHSPLSHTHTHLINAHHTRTYTHTHTHILLGSLRAASRHATTLRAKQATRPLDAPQQTSDTAARRLDQASVRGYGGRVGMACKRIMKIFFSTRNRNTSEDGASA